MGENIVVLNPELLLYKDIIKITASLASFQNVPDRALQSNDNEIIYVRARIEQVIAAFTKNNIDLHKVMVYCSKDLGSKLTNLTNVNNIQIKIPDIAYTMQDTATDFDLLSFKIAVLTQDLILVGSKARERINGICYNRPVTRAHFDTRWVLQYHDKNQPRIAESMSLNLIKS